MNSKKKKLSESVSKTFPKRRFLLYVGLNRTTFRRRKNVTFVLMIFFLPQRRNLSFYKRANWPLCPWFTLNTLLTIHELTSISMIKFPTRNLNKPNGPGDPGRAWWIIERPALPHKFAVYFSKVSLLCVSHPGRPRQCSLSHFHILEFLELFLTTLIQSLRPEMEFRMLEVKSY